MKVLNITDLHLTDKRYAGRKDDFKQTQLNKLQEVGRIIKNKNVDFVLINGDMFDTPRIDQLFLLKISLEIKKWGVKTYVVPGNHDLYNDNIVTLNKTHLGLLAHFGTVEILRKKNPIVFEIGDYKLGLQGKEYEIAMEHKEETYMYTGEEAVDFKMLAVHGMLMDKEPPFDYFTLVKDIKDNTNANILTTGHYHPGFNDIIEDDFAMFNPKSMIRTKRIKSNMKRIPGGKILTFTPGEENIEFKIEDFELIESFIPYEDAFKEGELEEFKAKKSIYKDFKDNISNVSVQEDLTHEQVLREIAKEKEISEEILIKAIKIIGETKASVEKDNLLEGYVPSDERVYLKTLKLENFMCYTEETFKFSEGTTAFIGRSGNGKSTVLRALKWLYYNEPSGNDFIQTGQARATVTGTFSNGYTLIRTRSNSDTGEYIIIDPDGNEKELKNFSYDFPIEVTNIHQTPKVNLFNNGLEDLAFSNQLDQHFLITESGGNIATAIGNLANAQPIDLSIKEIKRVVSNQNREIKTIEKNIDLQNEKLDEFTDIEALEKNIEILKDLIEESKRMDEVLKENEDLILAHDNVNQEIEQLKEKLEQIPDLETIVKKKKESVDKFDSFKKLVNLESDIHKANESIEYNEKGINSIPDLQLIELKSVFANQMLERLSNLTKKQNDIKKYSKEVKYYQEKIKGIPELSPITKQIKNQEELFKTINTNKELIEQLNTTNSEINIYKDKLKNIPSLELIETKVNKSIDLIDSVKERQTLIDNLKVSHSKIKPLKEQVDNKTKEIESETNALKVAQANFNKIIQENNVCPLCGTENLAEDNIKNILKRG